MQDGASAPLQYSKIRSFGSVAEIKGVFYSNSHMRDSLTIVPLRHILFSNIISLLSCRTTRYSQYVIDFDIQMLIQKAESLDFQTRDFREQGLESKVYPGWLWILWDKIFEFIKVLKQNWETHGGSMMQKITVWLTSRTLIDLQLFDRFSKFV